MTVMRELGFMEARMHLLHAGFDGSTQGGLAMRIEGELDGTRLAAALERVKARHEILSCVIEEREGSLYFVKADVPLPLTLCSVDDDSAWRAVLAELNDQPLAASSLWRIVVLSRDVQGGAPVHDLLLFVHHALMDGSAADNFLEALLEAYAGVGQEGTVLALPPAAEHAVPPMLQLEREAWAAWQKSVPAANAGLAPLPHRAHAAQAARHTQFDTVQLDASLSAALEARARAAGSTLNSWLSAALIQAVGAHTPGRERLALYSTFSLRRLCAARIKPDDIACCMAIVGTAHALPVQDLEMVAREHHAALAKAVLQQTRQRSSYRLDELRADMASLKEATGFALDLAFTFGESRLKPQYGPLRVVHLYPIVNRRAGNVALAVHGVRFNGCCHLTFNRTDPLQSGQWAGQVRQAFIDALDHPNSFFFSRAMESTE